MTEAFHTVELSDSNYDCDGLRTATVKSRALGRRGDLTLWIPAAPTLSGLLVLLHGVWGSHWVWSLKGGVHHTAQTLLASGHIGAFAIAMPSDGLVRDGSAYLSWPGAEDIESWIVDEVPALARIATSALSADAPVAIGGLSMGGFGALRLGAKYSHRFCAISAHSSITDAHDLASFVEEPLNEYLCAAPPPHFAALHWLRAAGSALPPLRFDCGLDDPLLSSNRALHQALDADGIPHIYEELPGGHDWSYWRQQVNRTLTFADQAFRNSVRTSATQSPPAA